MALKWFKNKIEKKSVDIPTATSPNFSGNGQLLGYSYGMTNGIAWLQAATAWQYYTMVAPIYDATKRITTQFSSIDKVLENKKGEILRRGDANPVAKVLDLLEKPNMYQSGIKFSDEISNTKLAIGEFFCVIEAKQRDGEPKQLHLIDPSNVSIIQGKDGLPYQYVCTQLNMRMTFTKRINALKGKWQYVSDDWKYEIMHDKSFNPKTSSNSMRGLSPYNSLYLEIEQYLNTSIHNKALLENGARPSIVITFEGTNSLNQDQVDSLKAQIRNHYQGANNAGNALILDGDGKISVKEFSINAKDGDFLNMKKNITEQIYQSMGIPKPFVSEVSTQNANYTIAPLQFYDMTVLPFADRIFDELTAFLLPRYEGGEDWRITYVEKNISALQVRFNEELKRKSETGIYTTNELRIEEGREAVEGGDVVYIQSNLVPMGTQPALPIPLPPKENEPKKKSDEEKQRFLSEMQKSGMYSEEEIKANMEEFEQS